MLDRTSLSHSTHYCKIGEGSSPTQLKISVHGAGWRGAEVERGLADPAGYRAVEVSYIHPVVRGQVAGRRFKPGPGTSSRSFSK